MIEGSQQECFDALVDYESFPDWQRVVKSVEVVSRHRDGRGKHVAFEVDAHAGRYTLDYSYEEPHHVGWRCLEGQPPSVTGEVVLENRGDGTTLATCSLTADRGGPLDERALGAALEDLKERVEA